MTVARQFDRLCIDTQHTISIFALQQAQTCNA